MFDWLSMQKQSWKISKTGGQYRWWTASAWLPLLMGQSSFTADVMHETLSRTALSGLKQGSPVNLERAMPAGGRFGGHIVTGHIDGTGTISKIQKDTIAVWYTIQTTDKIARYIIEKGSIAIDGISLTVASGIRKQFSCLCDPPYSGTYSTNHKKERAIPSILRMTVSVNMWRSFWAKKIHLW